MPNQPTAPNIYPQEFFSVLMNQGLWKHNNWFLLSFGRRWNPAISGEGTGTWPGGVGWPAMIWKFPHIEFQVTSPYPTWEFQENHRLKSALKKWRDISVLQEGRKHGDDVGVLVDSFWWLLSGKMRSESGCPFSGNIWQMQLFFIKGNVTMRFKSPVMMHFPQKKILIIF